MRFAGRSLTPKARRFLAIGNLCLVAGLTLSIFDKDLGLHHAAIYDAIRGFLLGLAIAFNFGALGFARSCPENRPRTENGTGSEG
ncbi:MAG: hypothetical protein WA802_08490 [Terracidiphilus sp.]